MTINESKAIRSALLKIIMSLVDLYFDLQDAERKGRRKEKNDSTGQSKGGA